MTINDMIQLGVTLEGERRVTAMCCGDEVVLYKGSDEWSWLTLDEEWANWEVNYIYPLHGWIEIELDMGEER